MGQLEVDDFTSEFSAEFEEDMNGTQLDADELSDDLFGEGDQQEALLDYVDLNKDLAYLPCAAHHFQLVLKDGFKLDKTYDDLLKRVTTMVGKSKNVPLLQNNCAILKNI